MIRLINKLIMHAVMLGKARFPLICLTVDLCRHEINSKSDVVLQMKETVNQKMCL